MPASEALDSLNDKSRVYSLIKYSLAIAELIFLLLILIIFQSSGSSRILANLLVGLIPQHFLAYPAYFFIIYLVYYLFNLPINFCQSFFIERQFGLSNQKISDWIKDQLKSWVISCLIIIISLEAFYYSLKLSPSYWWLIVSAFWIFFNLVLAKIAPVVIIPLFFKYKNISDDRLKQKILGLASRMKVKVLDVFEIDFSRKSLKGNAAFVGMDGTKRILLADTLKEKYNYDEIEVILAHEFAHFRLKHLLKLVIINSLLTIVFFWLFFKTNFYALNLFGLDSLSEVAAMPFIFIYFIIFSIVMDPVSNFISRRFETNADRMSIQATGLKESFISAMEKLSIQNLADRNPHPIIKFIFFSHPPIGERIKMAEALILKISVDRSNPKQ
ncbi:MAG: M48 family metallopeptidase [Candidatus Omnitrophota bacterium]|nr:M48 family metallopeptidase [Candidatus Omnitrophota bacterium]